MRLSNSSLNKYLECGLSYKYHYIDKIRSIYKGSALFFGGAIDLGLNELLLGKGLDAAKAVFIESWSWGDDNLGNKVSLFTYPYITYSNSEFDFDLLTVADLDIINMYYNTLKIKFSNNIYTVIQDVQAQKKAEGLGSVNLEMLSFYNCIHWCILKNKGLLMLEAYEKQLLSKFKRVIDIQKTIDLASNCGTDSINGVIDMVAELHDGSIAIIDNKTSSVDYTPDSVRTSQQLTIYQVVLNNLHYEGKYPYKIDKCGYAVVKKRPKKEIKKTCKSCGYKTSTSHKTCNNEINKVRCNGEWDADISFSFETQFIVDTIAENQENIIFDSINYATKAINEEIYTPNLNSCIGKYGRCIYYNKCHLNNESEYVTIIDKEKKNV